MTYARQAEALVRHLSIAPFHDQLKAAASGQVDLELWKAIVEQAVRLAEIALDPLGDALDRKGVALESGNVAAAPEHRVAWRQYCGAGWLTLSLPVETGGQALPLILSTACEELFNRASPAFMMLPTPSRTAAALLHDLADPQVREQWVPRLITGDWGATICISEPDAGSDVGRIRTRASQGDDRAWRVTGEKCWISFGDHDLTDRIGHCMLARTADAPGVRGLSLFLVPDRTEDGMRNGVFVRRIEEKMGLRGSPTCALGFEESEAILIGTEGRGLQQRFHMMLLMRLSCGPQGIGVAAAAYETALGYAQERRQGGPASASPVPIATHADIQRQLLEAASRVELGRGLALATAAVMDLSVLDPDAGARQRWSMLAQFLLPIVKDGSAWCAVDVANIAIQVLGGAGYTREWPVERMARDARVFPVFEGTTGIQALDVIHRRLWRDRQQGLQLFLDYARADADDGREGAALLRALDRLAATAWTLCDLEQAPREAEAGATAFLDLCVLTANGWIAARLLRDAGDDAVGLRLKAAARFALAEIDARSTALADMATMGADKLAHFDDLLN